MFGRCTPSLAEIPNPVGNFPGWEMPGLYPIASMYGIFTYIYHKNQLNVGKYTIHGFLGAWVFPKKMVPPNHPLKNRVFH